MTKIMLVEDDNNLREIYEARLSAEGYEIVSAENGEAALAMAAKERPDMIISDVMMPKISGFEMLDILRNTNSLKNVKIIMLTALGQAEDSQRANSLGADRYLVKSQVTLEDIVKAAHDLLDDPNKLANVPTLPSEEAPEPSAEAAAPAPVAEPAAPAEPVATEPVAPAAPVAEESDSAPAVVEAAPVEPAPAVAEESPAEPVEAPAEPAPDPINTAASEPLVPASVIEPTAPAPEPAVQDTQAPQTDDTVTPAPSLDDAVASTDAPADATSSASPMPLSHEPLDAPITAEPASDQSAPGSNPSVISIPVSDGSDDAASSPSPLHVVEPPAVDQAVPDYTSPENFSSFQAAESESEGAPEAQSEPVDTEPASPTDYQQAAPSVEIPSVVASPDTLDATEIATDQGSFDGPADPVLAPEELDGNAAPVISAPDGVDVPAPQNAPVPEASEAAATPDVATPETEFKDEQLREVAEDLAQSASDEASAETAATGSNKQKGAVVAPIADGSKPNLDQLLAVEEAKNGAQQAAQTTAPARPNVNAYNPSVAPAPQTPDETSDNTDPNSIAL